MPLVNIEIHLIINMGESKVMEYFYPASLEVYYKFPTYRVHLKEEWFTQRKLYTYDCVMR